MTTTRFRASVGAGGVGWVAWAGLLRSFLKNDMVMVLLWLLVVWKMPGVA